jgi:hypothetical protein
MKRVDLNVLALIDFKIKHRCTGEPSAFASSVNISRSTLFEYLEYMKLDIGLNILYDKYQCTYYYDGKEDLLAGLDRRYFR